MTDVALRRIAQINPPTPEFDALRDDDLVTFMPLEAVWSDHRLDTSARRAKAEVSTGYTRFRSGDVIVPKVSPTFEHGRSAVMNIEGVGTGTTELHVLRETLESDRRYLGYVVRTKHFLEEGETAYEGVAGLRRVSADFVASFQVPHLSVDEQRRIADFLDDKVTRINAIVRARQESLRLVEAARVSAARTSVLGLNEAHTVPIGLPWAHEAGEGWTRRRLSHLARMGTGHTPSRSNDEYWTDCDIPWLTTSDVHRFRKDQITSLAETTISISQLGLANSAAVLHPAGTVALSRTASAGFSIVMDVPMATSQDFVTWTCGPHLVPRFLLGALRVMRPFLLGFLAMGSTHKTIYFPDLQDIAIPVPDVSRQRQIAVRLDEIDDRSISQRAVVADQIALLNEYKQSLITAAVTGEFAVSTASERSLPS